MKSSFESTAARPSFSISRTAIRERSNSANKSVSPRRGAAGSRRGRDEEAVGGRGAGGPGPRRADLVEQERRLGDAEAGAPVRLGHDDPEPAAGGEGLQELPGVLGLAVLLEPVLGREAPRDRR